MRDRDLTVAEAAEKWLSGRAARQELAAVTVADYRRHLASFAHYVGPDRLVADLDEDDFEGWLGQLRQRSGEPMKPSALNSRASVVRAWAGWCARRRVAAYDITAGTGRARVPQRPPKRLEAASVRALLDVADARERAVLLLAFGLGLRRAEIAGLQVEAWDRARDELEVLGKGSKTRVLPVDGEVRAALVEWLALQQLVLPVRDLALVALNRAGLGCQVIPTLSTGDWDQAAGVVTVLFRGRPRPVQLEGADRELVGRHVASLPGYGRQPGPLFPSNYHRRPDEPIAKDTAWKRISVTRSALATGVPEPSRWLFPSDRRADAPLALSRLSHLFVELGDKAGLAKRLHPHVGRHSFASELVENGADLGVVRDLLGHSSLSTTSVYVSARPERMRSAVAALSYMEAG